MPKNLTKFDFSWYGNIGNYGWVAFYDYFERLKIVKHSGFKKFKNLLKTGVFDMIQLQGFCFVCPLPSKIKRDINNRLHSIEDSAISWKDGFELFYLHGVAFDKELWARITHKQITALEVLNLKNIEQRYVALKILGAEKILQELNASLISETRRNKLYEITGVIRDKPLKLLRYTCPSTAREYVSFVPPEMVDADEAQAWKFKLTKTEYEILETEA